MMKSIRKETNARLINANTHEHACPLNMYESKLPLICMPAPAHTRAHFHTHAVPLNSSQHGGSAGVCHRQEMELGRKCAPQTCGVKESTDGDAEV